MAIKQLAELLACCTPIAVTGNTSCPVTAVCFDSRKVEPGSLFIALSGLHHDGNRFIPQVISHGATAIVTEKPLPPGNGPVTWIRVKDARRAMAQLAAAFHDYPADKLKLIGVTGTDGKSSTIWFIQQLLQGSSQSSGFISTTNFQVDDRLLPNLLRQSTPEAPQINALLQQMVTHDRQLAVLEATSHGLSLKTARLAEFRFEAAVCTNLSHEHLEFHGTFGQYRDDKANLFRQLRNNGTAFGILNSRDAQHSYFAGVSTAPVFKFGLEDARAELSAWIGHAEITGTDFTLAYHGKQYPARLNIPGAFFVENLLAALLTVLKILNTDMEKLLPLLPGLTAPTGRMHRIMLGQPFHVIVDYAHTPKSFEKIFQLIRPLARKRLITVFGSAGERDLLKRPLQGEIAARASDIVVLTDEDPRGESPQKILREIAAGCRNHTEGKTLFLIPGRKAAIKYAFDLAAEDDTVLLLGKGHESSIIYADGPQPWNEIDVCGNLLVP